MWKNCPNFSDFDVTESGLVRNSRNKKRRRPSATAKGYRTLGSKSHGNCMVHRMVLDAFVGPIPDGYQVNHKNGIKHDNRIENLEYVTPKQNVQHAASVLGFHQKGERNSFARFNDLQVRVMKHLFKNGLRTRVIAKLFNAPDSTISSIRNGSSWVHIQV